MKSKVEKSIEGRFLRELQLAFNELGVEVLNFKFTPEARTGYPDRLILLPNGYCAFVELKRPGEQLRPLQEHTHKQLRALGHVVGTFDDPLAAVEFVKGAYFGTKRFVVTHSTTANTITLKQPKVKRGKKRA